MRVHRRERLLLIQEAVLTPVALTVSILGHRASLVVMKPEKADIHHLFPTDVNANSRRGSYPFGVVTGTPSWTEGGSKQGGRRFRAYEMSKKELPLELCFTSLSVIKITVAS